MTDDDTRHDGGGHRHPGTEAADAGTAASTGATPRRSFLRALGVGTVLGGGLLWSSASAQSGPLVVQDFESGFSAPGENALGNWTSAGELANGGGTGAVVDPSDAGADVGQALRLEYDTGGWFSTRIERAVAAYDRLELDVRGDAGGEGTDVRLEVGGVEGTLADLGDAAVGTSFGTVGVDLVAAGVDRSSVDDVWLEFWQGSGAIEIDEIRFATGSGDDEGPPAWPDGTQPTDPNDDGVYENLNGNERIDSDDVVVYFENYDEPHMADNAGYYDLNGNDRTDADDVVQLFESL